MVAGALALPADQQFEKRQLSGGSTANDFVRGGCKGVIMVYARASTEPGNIVGWQLSLRSWFCDIVADI